MESLSFLKEIVCLLSCQPRNMRSQLPQALDCLRSALGVAAVGICWMDSNGQLRPRLHRPARFRLDETLCQRITERTLVDAMRAANGPKAGIPDSRFSDREREILSLIGGGQFNAEIARALGISTKTVDEHRASLMGKLGIPARAGLISYALEKKS